MSSSAEVESLRSATAARYLLVEAAWAVFRAKDPEVAPLRLGPQIGSRRGRGIAAVALARKLAGVLFAMMRDGTTFDPNKWVSADTVRMTTQEH